MIIDAIDCTDEEFIDLLRADIERRGLNPDTMKIVLDDVKHDKSTRKMSFTFHFEGDQECAK